MRTSVRYKCGWGLNNVKYTPSLPLPAGEGTRVVAQLAHIPHPLKTTSLRENNHLDRSNPERISQLKCNSTINMDCHGALAPRNDTQPVNSLSRV